MECLLNLGLIKSILHIEKLIIHLFINDVSISSEEYYLSNFIELVNESLDLNNTSITVISGKNSMILTKAKGEEAKLKQPEFRVLNDAYNGELNVDFVDWEV